MDFLKFCFLFAIASSIIALPAKICAQITPLGSFQDDHLRIQALLGDSITYSFVNKSNIYQTAHEHEPVHNNELNWWEKKLNSTEYKPHNNLRIGLNPIFIQSSINSRFPHGENNSAAWYGRGNNIEFMGGFYATSPYLTINFYPHIIHQNNYDFLHPRFISRRSGGEIRFLYEGIGNALDAPFRFGPDSFTTFDLGYSSIRLHYQKIEAGLSNEPLRWGPAVQYPLIMSNNAPGIQHFFMGTRDAISIPYFGYIQFKWILGYPQESDYFDGVGSGETRFTNAANFAYSPSIFNNLTIGLTRVHHMYQEDGFDFDNVLVLFNPIRRSSLVDRRGPDGTRQPRNQTASAYFHLLLSDANAEIYGEFFREDHSFDFRDLFIQPHHNSGYSFGFQKISYIPWVEFIKTNIEFTNLTTSQLQQVRSQSFFYTHSRIRHGHTNRGQILGAAIGPGSNSQFFGMDAYKGNYKFGIFAQRVVDNDNFHFREGSASLSPSDFGDYFRHRVDLNFGLNFLYAPGPFYLNSRLVWTKAYNYGRFDYGDFIGVTVSNYERNDRTNVQFQIGITYVF